MDINQPGSLNLVQFQPFLESKGSFVLYTEPRELINALMVFSNCPRRRGIPAWDEQNNRSLDEKNMQSSLKATIFNSLTTIYFLFLSRPGHRPYLSRWHWVHSMPYDPLVYNFRQRLERPFVPRRSGQTS
ncbi:hypothetical protein [uncultured Desulfosarcina sp.]|uniref:hypothetical protein n=1 Tax=uncultured Desulfosarcina sp. TaxID=218289 RepID=UPI0029C84803|nr:hypothetical protein [uncultured Desulfosarcina sp.]